MLNSFFLLRHKPVLKLEKWYGDSLFLDKHNKIKSLNFLAMNLSHITFRVTPSYRFRGISKTCEKAAWHRLLLSNMHAN